MYTIISRNPPVHCLLVWYIHKAYSLHFVYTNFNSIPHFFRVFPLKEFRFDNMFTDSLPEWFGSTKTKMNGFR